jgi:hypothetical protein
MKTTTTRRDFFENNDRRRRHVHSAIHVYAAKNAAADTKVRLGFIGVGMRGQNHLDLGMRRNDVDVIAICDIQQANDRHEQRHDQEIRQTNATGYNGRTAWI